MRRPVVWSSLAAMCLAAVIAMPAVAFADDAPPSAPPAAPAPPAPDDPAPTDPSPEQAAPPSGPTDQGAPASGLVAQPPVPPVVFGTPHSDLPSAADLAGLTDYLAEHPGGSGVSLMRGPDGEWLMRPFGSNEPWSPVPGSPVADVRSDPEVAPGLERSTPDVIPDMLDAGNAGGGSGV